MMDNNEMKQLWDSIPEREADSAEYSQFLANNGLGHHRRRSYRAWLAAAVVAAMILPVATFFIGKNIKSEPVPTSVSIVRDRTACGEIKTVLLSDGTKVILNAASTLIYPENFDNSEKRLVTLVGEASFEVARNENQPFVVSAGDFDVTVLGTVFDVSCHENELVSSVYLKSGSVRMTMNTKGGGDIVLKPGQIAQYNRASEELSVRKEDPIGNWQRGQMVFDSSDFEHIARTFERTYGVRIHISDKACYRKARITAIFNTGDSLDANLRIMKKLIPGTDYSVEGNTIYFK